MRITHCHWLTSATATSALNEDNNNNYGGRSSNR